MWLSYWSVISTMIVMGRSGANLALLLLGSFRSLAEAATEQLASRGFEDFRPAHDFAMRAIAGGADNASELGRRLSVSKQAAAKTIELLEERGYVARDLDAKDARRKHLRLTPRGFEVLRTGEKIFDELRDQWAEQIGVDKLEMIESVLIERLKTIPNGFVDPGWLTDEGDTQISGADAQRKSS
jgi:DNA-binding MarR family transcriptional regulator